MSISVSAGIAATLDLGENLVGGLTARDVLAQGLIQTRQQFGYGLVRTPDE
jgi:hypothetical protein